MERITHSSSAGRIRTQFWVQGKTPNRLVEPSYLGKVKSRRGSKGLTRKGKRYVREGSYLMESVFGVKRLGFYTITIPSCNFDEAWEVAFNWTKIYKYFFKLLRNKIREVSDEPIYYLGVSENQSSRSAKDNIPYYHLHFICPCFIGRSSRFILPANTLRQLWRQALTNFVPSLAGAEFGASVDCQVLRKSAAGYLSKYFSKGSDLTSIPSICIPPSWYYSSRELNELFKNTCRRLEHRRAAELMDALPIDYLVSHYDYILTKDSNSSLEFIRGIYGQTTPEFYLYLFNLEP